MALSVQVPTVGQANSTEAVKVTNSLTNLSTWANGQIADTDLNSPNNGVRKLLLHSAGAVTAGLVFGAGTDYFMGLGSSFTSGQASVTWGNVPLFAPDAGLSSQPKDFAVANKTAKARIRVVILVNATTPGFNATFGLYPITALGGGSGLLTVTFGSVLVGTTVTATNPVAGNAVTLETAEFNLPQGGPLVGLGYNLSGGTGTTTANSLAVVYADLFGYNV